MSAQLVQPITHNLPIEEDIALHKKGWVIQRIGWGLMFLFLLLALLGLFGEGPLSRQKVQSGDIQLTFERFGRFEHGMEMRVQSSGENIKTISLPQNYLKNFELTKIVPEASRQVASSGYIHYVFDGTQNNIVTFYLNPVSRGKAQGQVKVNEHAFSITQLIYP